MKSYNFALISGKFVCIKGIILILSIICAAASCTSEPVPSSDRVANGISVNVLENRVYSTRSGSADGELFDSFVIDAIGGKEIRMDAYVSDITPDCLDVETKGSINRTTTLTQFKMSAYAQSQWYDNTIPEGSDGSKTNPNDAGEYFKDYEVSRSSTSSSDWSIANAPKWLNAVELTFWSRYTGTYSSTDVVPVPDASAANKAGISITNNGIDDLIYAFNKEKREFNEKTGEITEGTGTYNTGYKDKMDIKFYHALSAIRFDISSLKNDGLTIKKVTFKGAVNKATCEITNGRNVANDADSLIFAWTPKTVTAPETNTGDFSMEFASTDFTETGLDGTTSNALMPLTSSKFLFMIPQPVKDADITIELVYEDASHNEVTKTASLNKQTTPWKPGKYYTYKLTSAEYFFSLSSQSSSSTPVTSTTVSYESKTSDNSHDIQIYSTKNSTFSNWHIKSYQVGSEEEVNLTEGTTTFTAGGLTVSEVTSGSTSKLTVKANKWEMKSVGDNDYWTNKDSRKTDLLWSPASWVNNGVIDLSKFDFESDSPSSKMTTANCYIIRHAGTYKFPLVYGNGIENGDVITAAYAPTTMASGGTSARFLATFQNHKDSNITSAFIENNTGCTASTTTYPPYVVWSDNSGVITNVSIVGDSQTLGSYTKDNVRYVQFTIPQDKICQNNALIAVRDASGNIMWSWHIWTTNDPSLLSSPIHVTNYSDNGYDFFPLNCLGWVDAGKYIPREDVTITLEQDDSDKDAITITVKQPKTLSDDHSTGVHYQWGRKDPMPTKATGYPKKPGSDSQVTLGTAIKKPDTFIYYNSLTITNWCSSTYYNLWTGKKCSAGGWDQDNNTMIKTIYDPSPVGYKLPASSAFSGFSKTGDNLKEVTTTVNFNIKGSFSNGYYFYVCKAASVTTDTPTIFFPSAGIISSGNGEYKRGWDYDGNFWSAFPGQDSGTYQTKSRYGSYLSISYTTGGSKQSVMPYNSANLALGASVRPVKWK